MTNPPRPPGPHDTDPSPDDPSEAEYGVLDRKLTDIEMAFFDHGQQLESLTAAVETIVGHIETLYQGRGGGGGDGSDGPAEPCRWSWRYASGTDADALWAELREFVDWLNSRYSLDSERQVPPCWYRHSIGVEELTALMVSWTNAYYGPNTPRDDLLAWHSYWLWPCLDRLPDRAGWQRCKSTGHVERTSIIAPTDQGFEAFTTAGNGGED